MGYKAFYRVYRPQSFEEMSGQMHVKQTLQNALLHEKTTHAYLFSGPRGTGKTSAAKIFAKALNCENAPSLEPCNVCATCVSITEGSNTDVIEFDAASNSRVEEIREIIEKVRFAPSNARYKVYIIDEVHMLSNSAFNALLKTLEEPPAHAVFILATTESHKLPLTIISRCQRFDFKPITPVELIQRMQQVLNDVGIEAEDEALKVIAQTASGGMRDALSLLDQVVSFSGKQITTEAALFVTGSIGMDVFHELAQALLSKETARALSLLDSLVVEGKDVARLAEEMITFFRDLLLLRAAPQMEELLQLIPQDERFTKLAHAFEPELLYAYIDILAKTQQEMRFSHHAKVYVETALLKMLHIQSTSQHTSMTSNIPATHSEEVFQKILYLEKKVEQLQQQLESGQRLDKGAASQPAMKKASKSTQRLRLPKGKIHEVLKQATRQDLQEIREGWPRMLSTLQKSHAALLNETVPVAASPNAFVLKFKYEIHCLMATENSSLQQALNVAMQSITGKQYDIIFVPEEGWLRVREEFIQANGLQTDARPHETEMEAAHAFLEESERLVEDPLVTEAEKLFGKEFIIVHDD